MLAPVQWVVDRVEVELQPLRRALVSVEEQVREHGSIAVASWQIRR